MIEESALHLIVSGKVQGVFFRAFVAREASSLGLKGYVRNLADGCSVEILAEGDKGDLENLARICRQGPPRARVDDVAKEWVKPSGNLTAFEIMY
ncbi:MAG: acylphosphatase [Dehalococcoidia bacterium]|nr:acylphosphatase [Dehalococcoidia bacterium]